MIRTSCPHCNERLKAPDQLAGKKGRCPACAAAVPLPDADENRAVQGIRTSSPLAGLPQQESNNDPKAPTITQDPNAQAVAVEFKRPEILRRNCHYLICNSRDVVARLDDDGKGWMVQIKDGFVKAIQNPKQIPTMGNYVFIEIEVTKEGAHQRLTGVQGFTLPGTFVLNKLTKKNESTILEGIEAKIELNDRQRALVKQRINANYLPNIWDDAIDF